MARNSLALIYLWPTAFVLNVLRSIYTLLRFMVNGIVLTLAAASRGFFTLGFLTGLLVIFSIGMNLTLSFVYIGAHAETGRERKFAQLAVILVVLANVGFTTIFASRGWELVEYAWYTQAYPGTFSWVMHSVTVLYLVIGFGIVGQYAFAVPSGMEGLWVTVVVTSACLAGVYCAVYSVYLFFLATKRGLLLRRLCRFGAADPVLGTFVLAGALAGVGFGAVCAYATWQAAVAAAIIFSFSLLALIAISDEATRNDLSVYYAYVPQFVREVDRRIHRGVSRGCARVFCFGTADQDGEGARGCAKFGTWLERVLFEPLDQHQEAVAEEITQVQQRFVAAADGLLQRGESDDTQEGEAGKKGAVSDGASPAAAAAKAAPASDVEEGQRQRQLAPVGDATEPWFRKEEIKEEDEAYFPPQAVRPEDAVQAEPATFREVVVAIGRGITPANVKKVQYGDRWAHGWTGRRRQCMRWDAWRRRPFENSVVFVVVLLTNAFALYFMLSSYRGYWSNAASSSGSTASVAAPSVNALAASTPILPVGLGAGTNLALGGPAMCHANFSRLTVQDMSFLAWVSEGEVPVLTDGGNSTGSGSSSNGNGNATGGLKLGSTTCADVQGWLDEWFVTIRGLHDLRLVACDEGEAGRIAHFYHVQSDELNADFLVIRGSESARDWLEDFLLYQGVLWLQLLSFSANFVGLMGNSFIERYASASAFANRISPRGSGSQFFGVPYYIPIENYLKKNILQAGGGRDVYVVGHSLGGAIANIVAARNKVRSAAFEPPGALWQAERASFAPEDYRFWTFSVVSDGDIIPRIDRQSGAVHHLGCNRNHRDPWYCHSIARVWCQIAHACDYDMPALPRAVEFCQRDWDVQLQPQTLDRAQEEASAVTAGRAEARYLSEEQDSGSGDGSFEEWQVVEMV